MRTTHPKTAVVTGSNRGIGKEIARQLCQCGFAVFIASRDMHDGREAADELCAEGHEAIFLHMDVNDPLSIKNAVGTFSQKADHLDVLVNNAGILENADVPITKMNVEQLQRAMETNVYGPIIVIQDFLPYLAKTPDGARIINVSSGAGSLQRMRTYAPAYSISKTALNAVTRQFAASLQDRRIAVNTVDPGWVQTDMGGAHAPRSVESGAETIVWLATEAPLTETGKFWKDKREADW
ncbi:SDR family oxidoreductase [Nibrella saemangeumensis]|uniref:SDR family oxidoreductase n=1 Tax=Nibrella saemangeumensis TaxID=1084526 RepID=A0ABP8MKA7_9BACT